MCIRPRELNIMSIVTLFTIEYLLHMPSEACQANEIWHNRISMGNESEIRLTEILVL